MGEHVGPVSHDLVIVGGGNAGLAAALAAADLGMVTVVVEKTDRLGGQLWWSSGHFSAAGTRRQRDRGIEDDPDLHFSDVMEIGHGRNNPELVRLAVDQAPAAVDWLEGLEFPFAPETPAFVSGHERYARPRTYWGGDDPTTGGLPLLDTLVPRVQASAIDVRYETAAQELEVETDASGRRVTGVVVSGPDGSELLKGRHTVLATGGYAASRGLVAELQPRYANALTGCLPHASGDGHQLLAQLDVPLTHTDTYVPTMGMIEDPEHPGFGLRLTEARVIVDSSARPPWEIWVNQRGERFVAEDHPSPFHREQALLNQPGLTMYVIWDAAAMAAASPVIGPDWTGEQIEQEAKRGRWLHRFQRLDQLATFFEIPIDTLAASLADYGPTGSDPYERDHRPVPIEQPPFFAVKVVGGMLLSRGGPRVDRLLRPLDRSDRPIRNLYAVGELLGMGQFSGDSFAGGMSVGPALALGRWVVGQLAPRR